VMWGGFVIHTAELSVAVCGKVVHREIMEGRAMRIRCRAKHFTAGSCNWPLRVWRIGAVSEVRGRIQLRIPRYGRGHRARPKVPSHL
jgi:hypothetical protein